MLRLVSSSLILALLGSLAHADSMSVAIDAEWPTSETGLVASGSLDLPEVASVKSISVDVSHTWASDLTIEVVSPSGSTLLVDSADGPSGGNTDLGVAGTGLLDDVATYTFAPPTMPSGFWPGLGGGSATPNAIPGGASAGTWTFNVFDNVGGDGGAIGSIGIDYNVVPEPAFGIGVMLLGLCGLLRLRG